MKYQGPKKKPTLDTLNMHFGACPVIVSWVMIKFTFMKSDLLLVGRYQNTFSLRRYLQDPTLHRMQTCLMAVLVQDKKMNHLLDVNYLKVEKKLSRTSNATYS